MACALLSCKGGRGRVSQGKNERPRDKVRLKYGWTVDSLEHHPRALQRALSSLRKNPPTHLQGVVVDGGAAHPVLRSPVAVEVGVGHEQQAGNVALVCGAPDEAEGDVGA